MNISDIAEQIASTAIYTDNAEAFLRLLGVPEDAIERMNPEHYRSVIALLYVAIGAANEAGEALGAVKKMLRGDHDYEMAKSLFAKENRDTLWYGFEGMRVAGQGAEAELQALVEKLQERKLNGTIKGSGESSADRMERWLLIFLQRVKLNKNFMKREDIDLPEEILKALLDSGYLHKTISGVILGQKGMMAVAKGIEQGIIDNL